MLLQRRNYRRNFGTNLKSQAAKHILAQHLAIKHQVSHIFSDTGVKMSIDALLLQNPDVWEPSVSNEIGRLANGVRNIKDNNAM
jgi:hypothetical protein